MPRVQIKGAEFPVGRIFSNEFVFRVPLYQRPYAWQREQVEELLDDLLGFVGGPDPVDDLDPYFLGSVVLIKQDHRPDAEVVDGQQRLTTLTILLSALRNLLPADAATTLTQYVYERGNVIEGTPDRFRLTLRERDAEFFRDHVQRERQIDRLGSVDPGPLTDSQRNIRQNALVLLERLTALTEAQRLRLATFVVKHCLLVVVSTPDFDSAYRIFSVLNSRGLDLSHSDILKSELIGGVPAAQQEMYGERWEDAEESLGREAFGDLFGHVRTIFRKVKARDTILKEFREHVVRSVNDPAWLIDNVLVPFAEAYRDIRESQYVAATGADVVNHSLRWLNRIDNTDWVPPAILYLSKHRDHPLLLGRFFADLERVAAVQMLLRTNVNGRLERYGKLLAEIEGAADVFDKRSSLQLGDDEMAQAIVALNGPMYEQVPPLRNYVLLRLDAAVSGGGATYDHDLVTIEHVLPQSPPSDSEWTRWWPDAIHRESSVHKLGNLALLTRKKNSSARNFDFEKKKSSYFLRGGVSPFALTTQVVGEAEWTPEVFQRRHESLVATLRNLWRLESSTE